MREIPLTQGKVALVDDGDYEWLAQWKWCAAKSQRGHFYAVRETSSQDGGKTLHMHRLIIAAPNGMDVDHRDRDGLHNWRGNLRICTNSQNHANVPPSRANTSGYKGVSWYKRYGFWQAVIWHTGDRHHLGYFQTAKEAAHAYNEAAIRYFGDFAWLNKV